MARSVPIWKILRFAKVSLYLERFVPRHATAHIHNVMRQCKKRKDRDLFTEKSLTNCPFFRHRQTVRV